MSWLNSCSHKQLESCLLSNSDFSTRSWLCTLVYWGFSCLVGVFLGGWVEKCWYCFCVLVFFNVKEGLSSYE